MMRTATGVMLMMAVLAGPMGAAHAQTSIERGFGPYTLTTARGDIAVRLLRRESDMIWVDRQVQSGEWLETGIPRSDVVVFKAPRPAEFIAAEKARTPEEISVAIDQLRKMISRLRPFRDLPGIQVDEAVLLTARLNEQRNAWRDALQQYEDLLSQPHAISGRPRIRYLAGLCLVQMKEKEKALGYLMDDPVPEDDLALLSTVMQARGDCLASTGRHREAVDCYLSLIVYHPFEQSNEVRALSRIIPSYIELGEWDAVVKAYEALKTDYADTAETTEAQALLAKYPDKIAAEKEFHLNETVDDEQEANEEEEE